MLSGGQAFAYIGPGLGLGFIGVLIGVAAAIVLTLFGIIWYPLKRLLGKKPSVESDTARIDDMPRQFSGGMLQRLQIARNLVTKPRLVFMDEPTGGLDVSVQARLLDLIRQLVSKLDLAAVIVTHDLAVARLLSQRLLVMHQGEVVESGLTDQVLDDPQHPYTQLLVSSVLQV